MKVIEGFNEFFRKMSADEEKIFAYLSSRGENTAVKIGDAVYFYWGDDIGPRPASRFDKFDTLESYQNFNFTGYKRKDLPTTTYHVSYDEWYNQLTKYDDDEMKALFDQYKI
jgi:hypothetical protein|nr:MAG TPA_asm: hypothetical protein [Caudoviricetes sp.]